MRFIENDNALIFQHQGETGRIEAWGKDSLRVRTTRRGEFSNIEWALTEAVEPCKPTISIDDGNGWPFASITNGRLKATVNHAGVMSFYKDGELMLREYHRPLFENAQPHMEGRHRRRHVQPQSEIRKP